MRKPERFILHGIGNYSDSYRMAGQAGYETLHNFHEHIGLSEPAFHFFIDRLGNLYKGRHLTHNCPGDLEHKNIDICLMYGTSDRMLSNEAMTTLLKTIKEYSLLFNIELSKETIIRCEDRCLSPYIVKDMDLLLEELVRFQPSNPCELSDTHPCLSTMRVIYKKNSIPKDWTTVFYNNQSPVNLTVTVVVKDNKASVKIDGEPVNPSWFDIKMQLP